mgnify:FL=1
MKGRKIPFVIGLVLLSSTGGAAIAQTELPFLLKEAALMLPLQIAALSYVAWYWRNRNRSDRARSHDNVKSV